MKKPDFNLRDKLFPQISWPLAAYILTVLLSILFLWGGNRLAYRNLGYNLFSGENSQVATAKVDLIWAVDTRPFEIDGFQMESGTVYFQATIIGGERKGTQVGAEQIYDPFLPIRTRQVEPGDRVMLIQYRASELEEYTWIFQQYDRSASLMVLAGIFAVLLLLFGGKKGFHTILSLSFTCLAIFLVFIPLILAGYNIYAATFAVCIFITVMTITLINGYNWKSLSAAVGCLGGLLVSGTVVGIMGSLLKLTGLVDEESAYLLYMNPDNPLDLRAIIFSGILIGALGATLDVAVSMATSLAEIHATGTGHTFSSLLRSGMNIGRDIMGTMTNTLILAYIGGSLSISLLLIVYSNSLIELFNREMIVVEILQSISGSIGLLCSIPLTAVFAAYIFTRDRTQPPEQPAEN